MIMYEILDYDVWGGMKKQKVSSLQIHLNQVSVKNWDLMTHIKLMYMLQMKVLSMQFMKEGFIVNCGRLIKSKQHFNKILTLHARRECGILGAGQKERPITALNVVTNNQIDALDSIIVYNGKNPVFSANFRKKER